MELSGHKEIIADLRKSKHKEYEKTGLLAKSRFYLPAGLLNFEKRVKLASPYPNPCAHEKEIPCPCLPSMKRMLSKYEDTRISSHELISHRFLVE